MAGRPHGLPNLGLPVDRHDEFACRTAITEYEVTLASPDVFDFGHADQVRPAGDEVAFDKVGTV